MTLITPDSPIKLHSELQKSIYTSKVLGATAIPGMNICTKVGVDYKGLILLKLNLVQAA